MLFPCLCELPLTVQKRWDQLVSLMCAGLSFRRAGAQGEPNLSGATAEADID